MIGLIGYGAFFLTTALIFVIICLGLNVQWGEAGLFNVGISGFVAVGAYTSAILTTPPADGRIGGFGLPIVVGWLAAMAAAGSISALVGFVTLRLRADYLAISTFGVAVTVQLVALNAQRLTGGPFGIGFIPRPFAAAATDPLTFNLLSLGTVGTVALAVFFALEHMARSPWGRVLRALREDERAAVSLGKNVRAYRAQAFALGGAVMGLAGAVQGHFIGFIAPDNYLPTLTFQVWAMLIAGGAGRNLGALLGGVVVWAIWVGAGAATSVLFPPAEQARAASLQMAATGVLLCVVLLWRPRGLVGRHTGKS